LNACINAEPIKIRGAGTVAARCNCPGHHPVHRTAAIARGPEPFGRPTGGESPRCIEQCGALCNLIKEIVMATAKKAPAKKAPAKKAAAKKG
jgi:hypothetical protein